MRENVFKNCTEIPKYGTFGYAALWVMQYLEIPIPADGILYICKTHLEETQQALMHGESQRLRLVDRMNNQ
uniref:Uncharacterized protein n=1 Tax=viral metagenome TaxID=1070528 RepID=A0A6M3ID32_9ZZZZ